MPFSNISLNCQSEADLQIAVWFFFLYVIVNLLMRGFLMKQKSKGGVKMKLGKIQNISQCCSLARFTKGMFPTHKASLKEQAAFNNTIFFLVVCCLIQS